MNRRVWIALWVVTMVAAYVLGSSGVLAGMFAQSTSSVSSDELLIVLDADYPTTTVLVELVFPRGVEAAAPVLPCVHCDLELRFEDLEMSPAARLSLGGDLVLTGGEDPELGYFDGDDYVIETGMGNDAGDMGHDPAQRLWAELGLTIVDGSLSSHLSVTVTNLGLRSNGTPFPEGTFVEIWGRRQPE